VDKIQSLWIGKLSPLEQLCIRSFLKHGHEFHLYAYGTLDGVPNGCIVRDANEILPELSIAKFKNLANFSDLFRLALLHRNGGWWVDMDVCCLKPFEFTSEHVFSSQYERNGNADETNNGVIRAPKNSAVMRYCIDRIAQTDTGNCGWAEIGPALVLSAVRKFGLRHEPHQRFCPIHYFEAPGNVFGPGSDTAFFGPETFAVHLWNEEARRAGIDKFAAHPGSLFERLARLY
jgi:hypothetical protein